jgi:hypothetical protein
MANLGLDAGGPEISQQQVDAAKFKIPPKDLPNGLGLLINHGDLAVLGVVTEGHNTADPKALALGGGNLVADAL